MEDSLVLEAAAVTSSDELGLFETVVCSCCWSPFAEPFAETMVMGC